MTPEERDLRRALDARSGQVSPEFRARLGTAFNEGRPASSLMQAVAVVAVVAITLGTVGVLLMSRSARNISHQGPASGSRLASPMASPATIPIDPTALLSAPSSNVVWALVGNNTLFRSIDKGNTWEQRSLPAFEGGGLAMVSFVDDRQGWLCSGARRDVFQTTDGGATWRTIALVTRPQPKQTDSSIAAYYQCNERLSFVDPTHGFLTASDSDHGPTIYRTVDGGKTWSGSTLPDPPDFTTIPGRYTLRASLVKRFGKILFVQAYGMQPGATPDRRYVFRSTDGGATWSWMTKIPSRDVVMVTEARWLQLTTPGFSTESTNSGQQWHPYASDFNAGGRIVFGDSQVGYAEAHGALLRTFDGGLHWERIAIPGSSKLALLPVTDPGFTCRLPVVASLAVTSLVGGFVPVPGGSFQSDPAAGLVVVDPGSGLVQTSAQPTLKGARGLSFDAPFSRWVPARPEVVSADGSQYAWFGSEATTSAASPARTEWTVRLHVTSVADGTDRSFAVGGAGPIAFTKDGVLLTHGDEHQSTVWRLNPATASLTKLSDQSFPTGYSGGAVWLEPLRGPNPVGSAHTGDTLTRLDLVSGAVVDWFHRDNVAVRYVGTDAAGNPWVMAVTFYSQGPQRVVEIWRVRGPGQADLIFSGQQISRVSTDSHGTWFANETGVYLYSSGRVQRVSSASVGEVVGPCI